MASGLPSIAYSSKYRNDDRHRSEDQAKGEDHDALENRVIHDQRSGFADPNELKPNVETDPNALPPLQQSNQGSSSGTSSASAAPAPPKSEEMADISSSKKKKKKGLAKLNPF